MSKQNNIIFKVHIKLTLSSLRFQNDILKNRIKELEGNNIKRRLRRSSSIDLREKYRNL